MVKTRDQVATAAVAAPPADQVENDSAESESEEELEFEVDKNPTPAGVQEDGSDRNSESDQSDESDDVEVVQTKVKKIKKKKNNPGPHKYDESTEKSLESFLFGSLASSRLATVSSSEDSDDSETETAAEPAQKKVTAKRVRSGGSSSSESDSDEDGGSGQKRQRTRAPAWQDEDDEETLVMDVVASYGKAKGKHGAKETSSEKYSESIRKKFITMVDTPKWADLSKRRAEDHDSDDEFFRETADMLEGSKRRDSLAKGHLEYRKLKDLNETSHAEGTVIRAAEFHPHAAVGLVAGLNGTATLFKVDGKTNPKIQTVNFQNFPIKTAHFTSSGSQFVVGSQHYPHYFVYDLNAGKTLKVPWKGGDGQGCVHSFEMAPAGGDLMAFHGRFGAIHLLSQRSKSKLFTLKMNDHVNAVTFSPDGTMLYSHGAGGEIYVWDLKAQDCVHRFADDGSVRGTALAVSKNNRYLAAGSDSGVVNIYNRNALMDGGGRPQPEKVVLNLTTAVTSVKFNPTSELLCVASELKENAVKMVHLPSMTVYQNFPSLNYNLKRVNCVDFSLSGGYMSMGNNRGAANLYRLKYFGNY